MDTVIYYQKNNNVVLDFFPTNISEEVKTSIRNFWEQEIPRKILLLLSEHDELTAPLIKEQIGHSMSTLHENIQKMEQAGLLKTEMIYRGNKQKVIRTQVLCVMKNTPLSERITRFLNQGLWVDKEQSKKVVSFLQKNADKYYSVEEISSKTKVPVDEVQTYLENWESQVTRSFSDFLKQTPFEKKVLYKGRK